MKKIFVLPLCIFFAFCSSSKKAATTSTPGISNVNVSRNDTMTSAANVSSSLNAADKDFAYTSKHDTALNGRWILEGMASTDGSWSDTQNWYKDSSATVTADTAMIVSNDTTNAAAASANTGKKGKKKNKRNP